MRHARIVILSAMLFSAISLASEIPSTKAADHSPSISELEQLSYTPTDPSSASNLPYTEILTVRGLFLAYDAGSEAVSKFRDPILTGYSGKGEHRFRREAERRSGVKVNSSRSEATLTW